MKSVYIIKKERISKSTNTYCMNVSHAMPDDIKHFQQAEPEHYFDYKNWRLKICINFGDYISPVSRQKAT